MFLFVLITGFGLGIAFTILLIIHMLSIEEEKSREKVEFLRERLKKVRQCAESLTATNALVGSQLGPSACEEKQLALNASSRVLVIGSSSKTAGTPIVLPGCHVEIIRALRRSGKLRPRWHEKNALKLFKKDTPLVPGHFDTKELFFYFNTSRELERWYVALQQVCESRNTDHIENWANPLRDSQSSIRDLSPMEKVANCLIQRMFYDVYDTPLFITFLKYKIDQKLSLLRTEADPKASVKPAARVKAIHSTPNTPIISNFRGLAVTEAGHFCFDFDFLYTGGFSITIDVDVNIDLLRRTIPVEATVKVLKASGSGHIELSPPPAEDMWFGFLEEPEIELDVKTHIGFSWGLGLTNVSKLASIVVNRMKGKLLKFMIMPFMDDFPLPYKRIGLGIPYGGSTDDEKSGNVPDNGNGPEKLIHHFDDTHRDHSTEWERVSNSSSHTSLKDLHDDLNVNNGNGNGNGDSHIHVRPDLHHDHTNDPASDNNCNYKNPQAISTEDTHTADVQHVLIATDVDGSEIRYKQEGERPCEIQDTIIEPDISNPYDVPRTDQEEIDQQI